MCAVRSHKKKTLSCQDTLLRNVSPHLTVKFNSPLKGSEDIRGITFSTKFERGVALERT